MEPLRYGDRKVYSVGAFNRGVADWVARLPTVWIEGEVTELRRHAGWANVFFTLKDPADGACLAGLDPRGQFDALRLDLLEGERVHVYGRPEVYEAKGELKLRALTIERFGVGDHLAALERLKRKLAGEGLFADARKRALPYLPGKIGLVTGNDAAAKRDVLTAVTTRFIPRRTSSSRRPTMQGPRAAAAMVAALQELCAEHVDVVVLARGGGSFDDLLPFSDERLVRAVAACPVPVVSAVGHEQDTPLCDLAADVRASTPTAAGRLVVPDLGELIARLDASRAALERGHAARTRARPVAGRHRARASPPRAETAGRAQACRSRDATARLRVLSPTSTLARGYAIVRGGDGVVRSATKLEPGAHVDVQLARAGSAPASRTSGERAHVRAGAEGARADRRATRARAGSARRGARALGARRASSTHSAANGWTTPRVALRSWRSVSRTRAPAHSRIAPGQPRRQSFSSASRSSRGSTRASSRRSPERCTSAFAPGDTVAQEGQGGVGFFLIREGNAKVEVGGKEVRTLGPGDHFGEIALITEGRAPRPSRPIRSSPATA